MKVYTPETFRHAIKGEIHSFGVELQESADCGFPDDRLEEIAAGLKAARGELAEFEARFPETRKANKVLNLTPHIISLKMARDGVISSSPSGKVARVSMIDTPAQSACGFDVVTSSPGEVTGMPSPESLRDSDTIAIVSRMVLDALGPEYAGLAFAPDTGPSAVRDEESGQVSYATRLVGKA